MELKTKMKEEFKVYSPLTRKSVQAFTTKSNDGEISERILLEGIASTTSRDLQDEIVSSKAIDSMANQALGLNIHADHWYDLNEVIGAIKDASVEDKQLHIKFLITRKHTPDIKDLLETGVNLGLSIGGYVTSYDEKNRIINEIELHEISLTAMPANWDTFGTVHTSKGLVESNCLTGACYAIVKNLGEEKMTSKEINNEEPTTEEEAVGLTKDEVIDLINEYMAEKEETISQEITEKVQSQLETLVEAKVKELLPEEEEEPTEEAEEETKAETDEEEEKPQDEETAEEEEEEKEKSLDPTFITEAIRKGISEAIGDDFVDQVASKMFGKLDQERTTKGSKFEKFMKSQHVKEEVSEEPVVKTTYSSKEAAEMLLNKQKAANPIMAAAMKNLK